MACLDPPMQRQPARHRDWFCPRCKLLHKKPTPTSSRRQPGPKPAARQESDPPSAYEQARLENIARNQRMLASLGLA